MGIRGPSDSIVPRVEERQGGSQSLRVRSRWVEFRGRRHLAYPTGILLCDTLQGISRCYGSPSSHRACFRIVITLFSSALHI